MEVTVEMEKDAAIRLPNRETFDFIRCINCDFVGLIETGGEDCPCCDDGALLWANEAKQEHSI